MIQSWAEEAVVAVHAKKVGLVIDLFKVPAENKVTASNQMHAKR